MSLRAGAETIIDQCLKIQENEQVAVVNDDNDQDLVNAITDYLDEKKISYNIYEYEEPETSGTEPPERIAEAMKEADVFIALPIKSISHTEARREANDSGTRGALLPGIDKEIWNGALQADYFNVKEITEKAIKKAEGVETIKIKTDKGTNLRLEVDPQHFTADKGIMHNNGETGNLPAGEIFTGPIKAEGKLVTEENIFGEEQVKLNISGGKIKSIENAPEDSNITETVENVDGADNLAEFGFGTNPEAYQVGYPLQDEKILGTVHIAIGDNCFCFPEGHDRQVESSIHWDFVLQNPTVWFDDEKVLDEGEPVFLD